jgi:hypothetical protein
VSLSARLIAIQGIGFTPIYVAVQGLLDYIAAGGETERRPKSTNSLKLRRIAEGKAWLVSSKSVTRARTVQARGFTPPVVTQPTLTGAVRLLGCKSSVRSNALRARAGATATLRMSTTDTAANLIRVRAAARAELLRATADTNSSILLATGGAIGLLQSAQAMSSCELVRARGVRNISDVELIAALQVVDIRR